MAAAQIAVVLQTDENQVRRVIAEFNSDGMDSLRPPTGGGHPRRIDDATKERVRAIALARPGDLGEPGTRWSLTRLRRYLIRRRVVRAISTQFAKATQAYIRRRNRDHHDSAIRRLENRRKVA